MNSSDEQWWDVHCGEYVLGTLRGSERVIFEKIVKSDDEVRKRVELWKELFKALDDHIPSTEPPPHVLPKILQAIRSQNADKDTLAPVSGDDPHDLTSEWTRDLDETLDAQTSVTFPQTHKLPAQHGRIETPPAHNTLWKALALVSMAACTMLAAVLFVQLNKTASQQAFPVAGNLSIVQDSEQQVLWLLTASSDSDQVHILAVEPPTVEPGHHHQLWIVLPNEAGVRPVGILPGEPGDNLSFALPVPVSEAEVFSVSIEPGHLTVGDAPAGPVMFNGTIQRI